MPRNCIARILYSYQSANVLTPLIMGSLVSCTTPSAISSREKMCRRGRPSAGKLILTAIGEGSATSYKRILETAAPAPSGSWNGAVCGKTTQKPSSGVNGRAPLPRGRLISGKRSCRWKYWAHVSNFPDSGYFSDSGLLGTYLPLSTSPSDCPVAKPNAVSHPQLQT